AERAGLPERARLLAEWDLEARQDSRGAALFLTWFERLRRAAGPSLYGADPAPAIPRALGYEVLERRALPWAEEGEAGAAFDSLAAVAMLEADSIVGGRAWGELHRVRAAHALGTVAALERLLRLDVRPEPSHCSANPVIFAAYRRTGLPVTTIYC